MARRIPPEALAFYLRLGRDRSYQAVAEHFGVSKQAVTRLAKKEDWQLRAEEADRQLARNEEAKAIESLEAMRERHLKGLRAIQAKALEALRSMPLASGMDAVRALDLAIKHERVIRGEPGERSQLQIEDVIRREYERWLVHDGDDE